MQMLQCLNRTRPKEGIFTLNLIQGLVGFCFGASFLEVSARAPTSTAWTHLLAVSVEPSVASSRSGTRSLPGSPPGRLSGCQS